VIAVVVEVTKSNTLLAMTMKRKVDVPTMKSNAVSSMMWLHLEPILAVMAESSKRMVPTTPEEQCEQS
jgi:hypothetical protein